MPTIEEHCARYERLLEARAQWDQDAQDIIEYICPFTPDVTTRREEGSSRTEQIFDNTAVLANEELAATILGDVTSPAIEWYKFGFRDQKLGKDQEVKGWMELAGHIQLAAYNASNFYDESQLFHRYRGALGVSAMYVGTSTASMDPRLRNLRFKTLPYGSYVIADNADGVVDTLYWEVPYTPRQAVQRFRVLPAVVRRNYSNPATIDKPMPFLQCVYPREDYNSRRADSRNMPWGNTILVKETKDVVEESGFHEFPFVVSRWDKWAGSPWGYGPGHLALPEVRTLNKLRELNLLQLALWVAPPLKALQEGVLGNISLESYAVNVLKGSMDNLQALDLSGRPDLVQINQDDIRQNIRNIFYNDLLTMVPPPQAQPMTAYEIAQRIEQRTRRLGPAFHRLTSEMLDRLADRVFGLLWRGRMIPPPPQAVIQAAMQNRGRIDVEYTGVLARAQKSGDIRAMWDMLAFTGQMVQATQNLTLWDVLMLDDMVRHFAEVNNVPAHLVRDVFMVQKSRELRQQQEQALQQGAEVRENMMALGRVAPLVQAMKQQPLQQAA